MKYRYIGGAAKTIMFMGKVEFTQGEVVDVTDKKALAKLENNPSFEAVGGKEKTKAKPKVEDDNSNDEPKYHDMLKALGAADIKPKTNGKQDVTDAYNKMLADKEAAE